MARGRDTGWIKGIALFNKHRASVGALMVDGLLY